jgi:hypothetical protein
MSATNTSRAMSEAEQLLWQILEGGDIVGRHGAGRTILQLAVYDNDLERPMAFGADAAESEHDGDDEPYSVSTVHASWFEAA